MSNQDLPKAGAYRHYKGATYFVTGTARNSENPDQTLVIYSNLYGEVWARPVEMWNELIPSADCSNTLVPRFVRVE